MIEIFNNIADKWFAFEVAIFWQVAVLILIVWSVDLVIRKFAWPQLRYALWLLILVKLILPPTLTSPASFTAEIRPFAQKVVNVQMAQLETTPEIAGVSDPIVAAVPVENVAPVLDDVNVPVVVALSWKVYAFFVWIAGVVILSLWLIIRLGNLRREHLKDQGLAHLPERFDEMLAETARKLKLKKTPQVILTNKVCCPAVFGVFRPVLLMPADKLKSLTRTDVEHILLHELAHIKRGDLLVHAVYMILQIAYWFNPLLWLMRKQLQNLRELCCDATVAKVLKEKTFHYRETLLETARQLLAEPVDPGLGLLGLFENSNWLVYRLNWLEKKTWKNRPVRIVTIFMLICLMATCVIPMSKANPLKIGTDKSEAIETNDSFKVSLPTGVTVELISVSDYPDNTVCWQPDGSDLQKPPLFIKPTENGRKDNVGFAMKVSGSQDFSLNYGPVEGSSGHSGSTNVTNKDGEKLEGYKSLTALIPNEQTSTSITLGISTIPWETLATHTGRGGTTTGNKMIIFSQAFETKDSVGITVSTKRDRARAERIVAIGKDGQVRIDGDWSGLASNDLQQLTVEFHDLKLNDISEFAFQTRPYSWVTFKNVSLKPNFKTDVEITVEKPAGQVTASVDKPKKVVVAKAKPQAIEEQGVGTTKANIEKKLEILNIAFIRALRDLDSVERALDEVHATSGISDLEERSYPHPITVRLTRLQKELDDCNLEQSQLIKKIQIAQRASGRNGGESEELKKAKADGIVLGEKCERLEIMVAEAEARKKELDQARILYKRRMNIRDEILKRQNNIKSQIEELRIKRDEAENSILEEKPKGARFLGIQFNEQIEDDGEEKALSEISLSISLADLKAGNTILPRAVEVQMEKYGLTIESIVKMLEDGIDSRVLLDIEETIHENSDEINSRIRIMLY